MEQSLRPLDLRELDLLYFADEIIKLILFSVPNEIMHSFKQKDKYVTSLKLCLSHNLAFGNSVYDCSVNFFSAPHIFLRATLE